MRAGRLAELKEEVMMSVGTFDAARDAISRTIHYHWKYFLFEGLFLTVLGFFAVVMPVMAGFAVTILFGYLFACIGIFGMITTFILRRAPGFWWSLLSAILALIVGGWLLFQPTVGLASLTYMLIAFFIVEGGATIMFAFDHRRALSGRWEWMLLSGVLDLLLAAVIFVGLPGSIAWALGLIVGISLVFGGTSMIVMALAANAEAL
jgi:uncharacterized membrane protein HdeD (DUF308 family)